MMTGAQILMESLVREGVEIIFGFPGGALYDVYDELSRTPIRHVLVRHEQGAVHAADGYARASGAVGVCLVTSGPGATNTVTGVATAFADSIPLVILTGQVPTTLIGNDAFQEVDILGITRPCSKHNFLVQDVRELSGVLRKAFFLARSGRPGPVLVDLPRDVMRNSTDFVWPKEVEIRSYRPTYTPNNLQLQRVAELLYKAKKPLFIIGGGIVSSGASEILTLMARELSIPVVSTFMGLSGFPGNDPLWLGSLGMHGIPAANTIAGEADCIVAAGTRFADRSTSEIEKFASNAKIIQIDIDPTSIHKNIPVQIPLVADCKRALEGLRSIIAQKIGPHDWGKAHAEWLGFAERLKKERPLTYKLEDEADGALKPQRVIETLYHITGGNVIIATDVGQHQMWSGQFFTYTRPRSFISSGGLGTMGFGLPAAIGAQLARPEALVVVITGDGSFQMNIQELGTLMEKRLPIKILLLNNHALGMVRQWQELFYKKNYVATVSSFQPDFSALAAAYGLENRRIRRKSLLRQDLEEALAVPGATLIEVEVAQEENVSPLVPPGAALHEMMLI
ncbi:MAG: biosynthetic-type acetolactate synthase large subunit [Desulfovibrio sp.]|jgi:acetolactate synthase-1/2/3 large subunit|nr:biosynthetic-type acetolactate synthase large subunit [Desulfovibrio sp.]